MKFRDSSLESDPDPEKWSSARSIERARRDPFGSFVSLVDSPPQLTRVGPLAGIPYAAKDNLDTVRLPTTANTPLLLESYRNADNPVIARLNEAGAQLIGKTNMHELALGITTNAAALPATLNPHDPSAVAGGSSGGSAAAVASGVVPFALGTDTGGSISIPSAWCGVYGLRPTTGRWPSGGVVPLSPTRDTVGVIAENIGMLVAVDAVACGVKTDVSLGEELEFPLRIGIPSAGSEYVERLSEPVLEAWNQALSRLSQTAAVELIPIDTDDLHLIERRCGKDIEFYEISHALESYLEDSGLPVSYEQLCVEASRDDVQALLIEAWKFRNRHDAYALARHERHRLQCRYAAFFHDTNISSIMYPTVPITAPAVGQDSYTQELGRREEVFALGTRNVNPGSVAGQPVVTVPAPHSGSTKRVGLSIEGRRFDDRRLLSIAAAISALLGRDGHR